MGWNRAVGRDGGGRPPAATPVRTGPGCRVAAAALAWGNWAGWLRKSAPDCQTVGAISSSATHPSPSLPACLPAPPPPRARELLEDSEDSEDPAAVERQQQAERQREQGGQGRQALNGGLGLAGGGDSEGHLDADVESEQEGGRAAAPQRGGGLGGVTGEAAASERPGPGAPGGALSDA